MVDLKPMRTAEEIAAVPETEPVLIELTTESSGVAPPGADPELKAASVEIPADKSSPAPEKVAEPESPLQKQLDALKAAEAEAQRQLAESRAREAAAINAANQRGEALYQAENAREQAQYDAVLNAIGAAQAEADKAQDDLAAAMAEQDFRKAAEAQRRLSIATTRQVQLEDGKAAFEARAEQPRHEPLRAAPTVDPIDAMSHLSPKQKTWLKSHREVQSDNAQLARLGAAHWDALKEGHQQDSDGYFQVLEERLGYRQAVRAEAKEPEPQRRSVPMSAPVSRDAPSLSTGRPTTTRVELTAAQREAARISGVDDVTYARNLLRLNSLKQQGHYQERG